MTHTLRSNAPHYVDPRQEARRMARELVEDSAGLGERVYAPHSDSLCAELMLHASGWTDTDEVTELWGTDARGDEWYVVLELPAVDESPEEEEEEEEVVSVGAVVSMEQLLNTEMNDCLRCAVAEGYEGDWRDYEYTTEDCQSIYEALVAAGLSVVVRNPRSLVEIHTACSSHDDAEASAVVSMSDLLDREIADCYRSAEEADDGQGGFDGDYYELSPLDCQSISAALVGAGLLCEIEDQRDLDSIRRAVVAHDEAEGAR
jgi:hypothetical protein